MDRPYPHQTGWIQHDPLLRFVSAFRRFPPIPNGFVGQDHQDTPTHPASEVPDIRQSFVGRFSLFSGANWPAVAEGE